MRGVGQTSRLVVALVAGATVLGGLAACNSTVAGTAVAASQAPAKGGTSHSSSPTTNTTSPSTGSNGGTGSGSTSAQAAAVCNRLPKQAATDAFGVSNVTVTPDSGQSLGDGVIQVKCVLDADGGFRVNVVVQIYPATLHVDPAQFASLTAKQHPGARSLTNISGVDVAGYFQQTVDGGTVDSVYAAKTDSSNGNLNVVLAGVADSPGISDKLITFLNGLIND